MNEANTAPCRHVLYTPLNVPRHIADFLRIGRYTVTEGNFHILTMPRSGSKVLQAMLALGVRFKYGDVCKIGAGSPRTSLGEFLMFFELRHKAYSKNEEVFGSGRIWNLYKETPDEPVTHYDIQHIAAGRYRLVKADYSYFEAMPESAFRKRMSEMVTSPVPWIVKSFPAQMHFMHLNQAFIHEQLQSLRPLSTTVALVRRNIAHACISFYFMNVLDAVTPSQMHEKLRDVQPDQVTYEIGERHLNHCEQLIRNYLRCLEEVGYDKLVFMEDVLANPADVVLDLLGLLDHPDTLGLQLGFRQITDTGKETSAYFDYPTVISNYAYVVEKMQPAQDLINALARKI